MAHAVAGEVNPPVPLDCLADALGRRVQPAQHFDAWKAPGEHLELIFNCRKRADPWHSAVRQCHDTTDSGSVHAGVEPARLAQCTQGWCVRRDDSVKHRARPITVPLFVMSGRVKRQEGEQPGGCPPLAMPFLGSFPQVQRVQNRFGDCVPQPAQDAVDRSLRGVRGRRSLLLVLQCDFVVPRHVARALVTGRCPVRSRGGHRRARPGGGPQLGPGRRVGLQGAAMTRTAARS